MTLQWRVEVIGNTPSTQDIVQERALIGDPQGYVLQALQQENARGRHGNKWNAPLGNLYMSILLRPDCALNKAGELSFVVAVALSKAFDPYIDPKKHKKTLKWPNDVYIDGLKLSGILLEANLDNKGGLESLVLGIGVNIFAAPELAVSLQNVAQKPVYINVFRDEFLAQLAAQYALWEKSGFVPIRDAWLHQAHGLDAPITARLPNRSIKGSFRGIDEHGALELEDDTGEIHIIRAGDVHFGEADETNKAKDETKK